MDTAAYNRMVLENLRTDSPEVFGNLTPENARFIVPTFIEAAKESGRQVRTVEIKSQAPDHPSLLCADETQYLKFFVLQVQ